MMKKNKLEKIITLRITEEENNFIKDNKINVSNLFRETLNKFKNYNSIKKEGKEYERR